MSDDPIYVGWLLGEEDRRRLLALFHPHFPDVLADHVTLCREDDPQALALSDRRGRVVGHALDPEGVEALVVEIEGNTRRPDGATYHLTWSLNVAAGWKARHSNSVIAERGWVPVGSPIEIMLRVGGWPASRYP